MRSETKTVWIADNGAEFTSEMACLIYEASEVLSSDEAAEVADKLAKRGYALRLTHVESAPAPELAPDGWIEWAPNPLNSTALPPLLSPGTVVECRLRGSSWWPSQTRAAEAFVWCHDNTDDDIVAYRVVWEG